MSPPATVAALEEEDGLASRPTAAPAAASSSPSSAADAEEDGDAGPRAVVLVGITGDGKSTTGNTLCGRSAFASSDGLTSATSECAHADYLDVGESGVHEMRVIDTIGLNDTGLPAAEVMRRFATFSDLVPTGIDVFLFVVRWGRFRPDHEAAFEAFVANVGEAALAHTVLVFTSCKLDALELGKQLEAHAPESLRRLLPRLACAPCAVENCADAAAARAALHAAIGVACDEGAGRRYSNAALAEARARYDARREEERAAFAAAVADWRKGTGPVVVVRETEAETEVRSGEEKPEEGEEAGRAAPAATSAGATPEAVSTT